MNIAVTRARSERPLLSVRDLSVHFETRGGTVRAVNGVSFDVHPGETVCIVGESGSGKSVTALSILGLLRRTSARIVGGEVLLDGRDLLRASPAELRRARGSDAAMVFQDPMTSLNPVTTVGKQIAEAIRAKQPQLSRRELRARVVELLKIVGMSDPEHRFGEYPHQFSGGMRQRAMIAMAIANGPKLLIADEPTTALDVTIQAQIMEVLRVAQAETGAATILITHDMALVAEIADRIVVMYGGRVVETGGVHDVFHRPQHPYTVGLLASTPRLDTSDVELRSITGSPPSALAMPSGCVFHPRCAVGEGHDECRRSVPPLEQKQPAHTAACHLSHRVHPPAERSGTTGTRSTTSLAPRPGRDRVLVVENLEQHFRSRKVGKAARTVRAVDGVSFELFRGETLGLVGESGCGKSTTGRTIMGLLRATAGTVHLNGIEISSLRRRQLAKHRRDIQMVFQDPFSSIDPRMTVREVVAEPLRIHGLYGAAGGGRRRVDELLELVGLTSEHASRYAHEFSGGQRQRIGIARAIALDPDVLILDEPVSSLDVSIQAQIINLLKRLQRQLGLSYVFIAHDLAVVRHISHRVAVMYLGRIVEIGDKEDVYTRPTHPYTRSLLAAVPVPEPATRHERERIVLRGDVPNPANPPSGCNFRTRCRKAQLLCEQVDPALQPTGRDQQAACHFPEIEPEIAPARPSRT